MNPAQVREFLEKFVISQANRVFNPHFQDIECFKQNVLEGFDALATPLITFEEVAPTVTERTISVSGMTITRQSAETMDIKLLRPLIETFYAENPNVEKPELYDRCTFVKSIWGVEIPRLKPRSACIGGIVYSPEEALEIYHTDQAEFKRLVERFYDEHPELPRYGGYREKGYWPAMQLRELWNVANEVVSQIEKKVQRKCRK